MMDDKLRYLGWYLLAHLGNIADACLTLHAVSNGAIELNPLMSALIEYSPFVFISTKLLVFAMAVDLMAKHRPNYLKWVAVLYMLVASWHLSFILVL